MKIAIIGAGFCGLRVAQQLKQKAEVSIFEKSRGVGGRLATRYTEDYEFDHGAPYFSAATPTFQDWVQQAINDQVVVEWQARFARFAAGKMVDSWSEQVFIGHPKMNQIGKYLASNLEIAFNTRIQAVEYRNQSWYLFDEEQSCYGPFDALISTIPWPQAQALFSEFFSFKYPPMQATMVHLLGFSKKIDLSWDIAEFEQHKIVINSAKPGRSKDFSVLVYSPEEVDIKAISASIFAELPQYLTQHHWRYAQGQNSKNYPWLIQPELNCVVLGDWLLASPGVEASFLMAAEVARYFLEL